jgi:hypothetical protein
VLAGRWAETRAAGMKFFDLKNAGRPARGSKYLQFQASRSGVDGPSQLPSERQECWLLGLPVRPKPGPSDSILGTASANLKYSRFAPAPGGGGMANSENRNWG